MSFVEKKITTTGFKDSVEVTTPVVSSWTSQTDSNSNINLGNDWKIFVDKDTPSTLEFRYKGVQSSDFIDQSTIVITESQISDFGTYLTSFTEENNLNTAVTWANIPIANVPTGTSDVTVALGNHNHSGTYLESYTVTEGDVTAHEAALSITESQISDFGSYLTAEVNNLGVAVTWANVPYANIPTGTSGSTVAIGDHNHSGTYLESLGTAIVDADFGSTPGFCRVDSDGVYSVDTSTYLTTQVSHLDVLVDGDFSTGGFMKTNGSGGYSSDNSTYSVSTHVHEGTAINSTGATDGWVLTADGADGAVWEASSGGGGGGITTGKAIAMAIVFG